MSSKKEMITVTLSVIVAALFFVVVATIMVSGCAHMSIPDRSQCVIPWEQRKPCISDKECSPDQTCAFRGLSVGKCTLLECCDPWRDRGKHATGKNWCTQEEEIKNVHPRM